MTALARLLDRVREQREDVNDIVKPEELKPGDKLAENERIIDSIRKVIRGCLGITHSKRTTWSWVLMANFLVMKSLFIVNIVLQFILLGYVLGTNSTDFAKFGVYYFFGLIFGTNLPPWATTVLKLQPPGGEFFPKIVMCNFKARVLGNVHRHSVQCVLTMNLIAEKIYVVLWVWYLVVLTITAARLLLWVGRLANQRTNVLYVRRLLKGEGLIEDEWDKLLCKDFVQNYLKVDGVLLLRIIRHNTNKITTHELARALYEDWILSPPKDFEV